ncbi:peptidyl-tRNA hydrolase [Metschnikowia bicuspidata var. bicuspidata NRRL YB-4993]|uniref:Peptidyl-tRNA hydrolase n=1 Tax=Metschnikowia bicuspidata var. bicuspidata NRRL YB-4993 TaxID=869754 RepID=A0A1A0HCS0_9ASCO|nr:peptidyl-tRNA hydrolase [Metschnikowia bicuspidata var. bicuspidata NRRL YB-4993]OBA21801.1 peptidyl-tRNA hydrolase [Metschnikowia bicuspidata var. bicuspidata NRRL YB-4993]
MSSIVFFSVGNPGKMARHSVGHYILKNLMDALGAKQLVKKGVYSISTMDSIYFVKSNAYMNESGKLLRKFLDSEKLGQCVVIVIYDDFETPMPKVKLQQFKKNESHGGIKSTARELQAQAVNGYKLGIGIGPKPAQASRELMASWVLSDFKEEEKLALATSMDSVYRYTDAIISSEGEVDDCNKLNARVTKAMKSDL